MTRKYFSKKLVSFLLTTFVLTLTFQALFGIHNCSGSENNTEKAKTTQPPTNDTSFGIIVPLIYGDALPYTSIQQSIANMINDLLRIDIPVFWASLNFSAVTRTLSNNTTKTRFFERGAYIIPFTENQSINALIISIATDYELSSEIETFRPVKMYYVMQPLSLSVYPLQYATCAMRAGLNCGYALIYLYSDILYSSGFLDIYYLSDDELPNRLNTRAFNVVIWPGGIPPDLISVVKAANLKICKAIRTFVNDGGGYVGTCYGATSSTSGLLVPFNFIQNFKRNLPTIGTLSLTSCSALLMDCAATISIQIENHDHTISFGLEKIQESFHIGGPVFLGTRLSQNTQVVGVLKDLNVAWWMNSRIEKKSPEEIDKYLSIRLGKPIWISSYFGKGKVVDFGYHPEIHFPNRQDRVIDNAFFYITSEDNTTIHLSNSMFITEIIARSMSTCNITLPTHEKNFNKIWNITTSVNNTGKKIDETIKNITMQVFTIREKWKNHEEVPLGLHDYANYQHTLQVFIKSLTTLERVHNLSKNNTNLSEMVSLWRNKTTFSLSILASSFISLYENSTMIFSKLKNYVGTPAERSQLLTMMNNLEIRYRNADNLLNQLWSSTIALYRKIWYIYESKQPICLITNDKTSELPSQEKHGQISPINTQTSTHVLYVDDDAFIGGNGSINYPYQRIQDAIDASTNGDCIYVYDGVYYENLFIGKSIRLIGEDKTSTIIDGQKRPYHHIWITKPNVEITRFTIQNSSDKECGLCLYSSNNTIRDNIFKNNGIGLGLYPLASNNIISENLFSHNVLFGTGIDTVTQRNNHIENNNFHDNTIGLYIVNTKSIIRNNSFINDGFYLAPSTEPLIIDLSDNTVNGKPLICYKNINNFTITDAGAIIISNCSYGIIDNITLLHTDTSIAILTSSNITISDCEIAYGVVGVSAWSSKDITIAHNHIYNKSWLALWLSKSEKNHIHHNIFTWNDGAISLDTSTDNTIKNNAITDTTVGIFCWSSSIANQMYENNFIHNHKNAFDNGRNQWDANYWDDWRGLQCKLLKNLPYHVKGRFLHNFDRHPAQEPYIISSIS
ncbi:hypothetical protein AYK25_01780 [Thermoplasmatales archaeon SM1-50]|nr:MAG: hypothetical protein AYK25_01780 [Thermoplasmatales archaeon SM1-50]